MVFETYHPEATWGQHIEQIIYYKDLSLDHKIERVVPSGHTFLLFAFDGYKRKIYNETREPIQELSEVWISGPHSKALNISVHPNSEMMAVQFHISGARSFLHNNLSEMSNRGVPAEAIVGHQVLDLCTRMKLIEHSRIKFEYIYQWLDARFEENVAPPLRLCEAITYMKQNPYSQHHELVQRLDHSHKHFIHQSKLYTGLTPKTLHRLFRFSGILQRIQNREMVRWVDVCYETGYADQAHFAKDFFRFSGFNPSRFIRDFGQYPAENFFPIE